MASIVLSNVCKSFKESEVIKNIDLCIDDGKCTVLVGPSGCGKSTLLRLICGLEDLTSGDIFIGDRLVNDVPPASRGLAMVFQSYALYPHMTVFENMAFSLTVRKFKKSEIEARVTKIASILKIEHLLQRKPKELSGGQRQRVAIGRAIVRNPFAFLFDEPLSNLDSGLRCQMRYELAKLKVQLNTTMVYVTHDQSEAMTLADKIVVMRDGKIEQEGTPLELYSNPIDTFVAKFIGSSEMNIIPVCFSQNAGKLSTFKLSTGEEVSVANFARRNYEVGAKYLLGIRPEDIRIFSGEELFFGNKLECVAQLSENLGGEGFLHASLKDGQQISIKAAGDLVNNKPNDMVRIGFQFGKCYLFDENGQTIAGQCKEAIDPQACAL